MLLHTPAPAISRAWWVSNDPGNRFTIFFYCVHEDFGLSVGLLLDQRHRRRPNVKYDNESTARAFTSTSKTGTDPTKEYSVKFNDLDLLYFHRAG